MTNALSVRGVAKAYQLKHQSANNGGYVSLRDVLTQRMQDLFNRDKQKSVKLRNSEETFWALNDVSFDVKQGERVGIIGRNGAGKSTLLKIISRITSPTRGHLEITGRVASLLEVGTGFHPELTGRENIYLNGAVLGMSRNDIKRKFDEIVAFAEVDRFLDTPVKRYSSGMYMRLAFAVAAHLEPEILVVDEVLAVGDAAFQKKCLGKMRDVGQEGRTVLFVSHNMGAITEFCNRSILLNQGCVYADGTPEQIISIYSGKVFNEGAGSLELLDSGTSELSILKVAIVGENGQPNTYFELMESIDIEIEYVVREKLPELQITVTVTKDGVDIFHAFDNDDILEIVPSDAGRYLISYQIPHRVLKEGAYSIRVTAGLPHKLLQDISSGLGFEINNNTINTFKRSFRSDRAGQIISPGKWTKIKRN